MDTDCWIFRNFRQQDTDVTEGISSHLALLSLQHNELVKDPSFNHNITSITRTADLSKLI